MHSVQKTLLDEPLEQVSAFSPNGNLMAQVNAPRTENADGLTARIGEHSPTEHRTENSSGTGECTQQLKCVY